MNGSDRVQQDARPGRVAAGLVWVLAVCGAYVVAYSAALVGLARTSADRLPLVGRLLELLRLVN